MTMIDRNETIAQIVTAHPAAARVFQKHGLDYCCHGNVKLPEACEPRGLDPERLFGEVEAALSASDAPAEDPRTLSTPALLARIIDRHHGYLRRTLPYVAPISAKVAKVHGAHDPRLVEVDRAFTELSAALLPHLDEEEQVLFPALASRAPDPALLARELDKMMTDHLAVGDLLARIRTLTDDFTLPEWGCNTYRVLLSELDAIEADTLAHVHLENHVLMPRFVPGN
ncbi:iron-sulfur cluster repair di-iron protein [Anaeromyxobacter paludicola]|uniref:Iron-sulfur cluster repair di-iron protein n=1 Tax=Anaeromyxobacter paludicola TaxID=2918171 RepID=A0ABM7XF85_9BACT|nr:iron-sulfur cluster repair di-iron protein [Anaeromyxobacter paludicola]BDG10557.1 iron-sulfur cluster repair di-iron protein [Anaeromyxobacter paludicola]